MNVSSTAELEKYINVRMNELRQQIQAGINSGEPLPFDLDDVIERGKKRHIHY
ncbi:hypothetical protein ABN584_27415 [Gloeocapsa sp. BRSZ]